VAAPPADKDAFSLPAGRRGRKARRAARRQAAAAAAADGLIASASAAAGADAGLSPPRGFRAPPPSVESVAAAAASPAPVARVAGPPTGSAALGAFVLPPPSPLAAAPAAAAQGAADSLAPAPAAAASPRPHTSAEAVAGRRVAPPEVAGGAQLPPPQAPKDKDAAAGAVAAPRNYKAKDAEAVAAARLARAAAAGAALRRLADGPPARVTLRTVYVRGVARETRTWRLRQRLSAVAGLPERAVVDVDRFGDLAAVRLLEPRADAFEAAVALSPAADTLTLVRGVDPLSPSLLGAPRRRGLSAEAARETARTFFVSRTTAKLASLNERVGMPPAHRDALRQLLHRELAPHVRQLADGGGVAVGRPAAPAAAPAGPAERRGSASHPGVDRIRPVPPAAVAAAELVDADRRADEIFPPAASTPAWTSATPSENSVSVPTPPMFSNGRDSDAAAAEHHRGDENGADLALGVGKQLVTTTVTDPTPGSDRAPSARETEISADLKHAGNVSATRKPPSAPLADAVAEAVGRAPGGAVGALSLAAAMFRVASGAVDEAANAASAPRRLNPAAEALRDDAAEGRGVQIAAAAAAAAAVGIATSGPSPPLPQPLLSASARLAADVAGARRAEALLRRAAARVVAAHETPVAVARRMRTEALAGAA